MTDDKLNEDELNAVFEAAARDRPVPSPDWLARVVADADRERIAPRTAPLPSIWAQLSAILGGWRGVGGLALASAAGLWIGIAPPAVLGDPVNTALATDPAVEVFSGMQFEVASLWDEG